MDEKIVTPEQALILAMAEAEKGAAFVSPNPLVGCVIVDQDHKVIATGYHAKYGDAHAEADALRKVSASQLKNATVYVTLEPCAHQGKTPSCAMALIQLPIRKVVYGLQDPNPLVAGQGAEILRQAGIEAVEYQGELKRQLEEVCEVFLKNFREKKLFVALKVASSLDGQIALKSGESRWITGLEAREKVHALRARYDAIMVGRQTVEVDDPTLNIRHPSIQKENKLVILDPSAKILKKIEAGQDYQFLKSHRLENIFFAVQMKHKTSPYQQVVFENLHSLHQQLWNFGVRSIFVEGGAYTYGTYFKENLVDRLHLFLAPSIIGAAAGRSWTQGLGIQKLAEKKILSNPKIEAFGADFYLTARMNT